MKTSFLKTIASSKELNSSVAYFIANVINVGIAYLTTPLFTNLLSSSEFGQVSLYQTWKQLLGIIAMFCLSFGVFNNGMSSYPDRRDDYSISMLALSNFITIITFLVLAVFYSHIHFIALPSKRMMLLLFITFLVMPAYSFWIVRQRYEYKYKSSFIVLCLIALLTPLVPLLLLFFTKYDRVYTKIYGSEVTLITIYLFFYIYLLRKASFKINFSFWKFAFLFNLPLIPHYLSSYILSGSDKIMIKKFCTDSDVAHYTIAHTIGSVVIIIWSAANASLIPFTYENCKIKNYKSISSVTIPIILLIGVFCFIVSLFAPEFVSIMAPEEYKDSAYIIPPIILGVYFQVHYYVYANVIYYSKRTIYVMIASLVAASLNILLNYLFIPHFGYFAAGYTTLICYFSQAFLDYLFMRHIMHTSVYNMNFFIFFSFGVFLACFSCLFLYQFSLLRYLFLLLLFLASFLFKKQLFTYLSEVRSTLFSKKTNQIAT